MKTQTFRVSGFYRGAANSPVSFTLDAVDTTMVYTFVRGYLANFIVTELEVTDQKEEHHYCFTTVNPVVSARLHLRQRRRCASKGLAQLNR